jgi:CBS-domain-containing membrane protein
MKNKLQYLLQLSWVCFGSSLAIAASLALIKLTPNPVLLASLGGSTLFLFGLTKLPAAQPRALFGGHILAGLIGIICYQAFGDTLWVYVLSVVITIFVLLITRTVHPPAAANPLLMIQAHASIWVLFDTIFVGIFTIAFIAFVWSRIIPAKLRYPVKWLQPSPRTNKWSIWDDS